MTNWRRFRDYLSAGVVLSALLHFLVTGWGLFAFATGPLEAKTEDIVAVDVITDDKLSQMMKGIKTGDKDETKPKVDKIGDLTLPDKTLGKIDDKKPPIQPTAEKQPPKPEEKPIEKKPDPPKPVAEDKPKDPSKPAKEEPKIDQIAETLKQQDQQKDPPKPEAKQTPPPKPQKQYAFNAADTKALLDKRDPTRQSITGQQVNPKSQLGVAAGPAQKMTMSWLPALVKHISNCWTVPAGVRDAESMQVRILVRLNTNGMLVGQPELVEAPSGNAVVGVAFAQSAIRAIEQCQPYTFLPQAEYKGGWDFMDMTFSPKDLFH